MKESTSDGYMYMYRYGNGDGYGNGNGNGNGNGYGKGNGDGNGYRDGEGDGFTVGTFYKDLGFSTEKDPNVMEFLRTGDENYLLLARMEC